MDAAQLADDLKAQLELAQKKLHDFQDEIVENSVTKEKDMFNFKRAQVPAMSTNPLWPLESHCLSLKLSNFCDDNYLCCEIFFFPASLCLQLQTYIILAF